MGKMVQIRNVPDDVHRRLRSQAAAEGLTLSEFLLREVSRVARRRTWREVAERAHQRGPVQPNSSPEELIRDERDGR